MQLILLLMVLDTNLKFLHWREFYNSGMFDREHNWLFCYDGCQYTLAEFSLINWSQFNCNPFMHQLKMGHYQNCLHMSAPH